LFVGIQTVFEGYRINTKDKLRENQLKHKLKIPMAHAPGNHQTHDIPAIMRKIRQEWLFIMIFTLIRNRLLH
jgi:hypothetical protein